MVRSPQKQTLIASYLQRTSYTRQPSTPVPELPHQSGLTSPEPAGVPTAASSRGKRALEVYKKSYQPYPLDIEEVLSEAGLERDRFGSFGVRFTGNGSPVGKKFKKEKAKSPVMGESISVGGYVRMEIDRKERGINEQVKRERGKLEGGKKQKVEDQSERAKRDREGTADKESKRQKRRRVTEIAETDADEEDLISPLEPRRGSNATDSAGVVLEGASLSRLNGFGGQELMDLTGLEDSEDSEYIEDSDVTESQKVEEAATEVEETEEVAVRTVKGKKILIDSSQSSFSVSRTHTPSPARAPKAQAQKKGKTVLVSQVEPKKTPKKRPKGLDESSQSRSSSPSPMTLTPRAGVGQAKRRTSPLLSASKSKKPRITSSGYTLPPINTSLGSPARSRHKNTATRSPTTSTRSPGVSQPPCLRMSLVGFDDEVFTIPFSEVLTPAALETAIAKHFPQPPDTYIKLTNEMGDIIKLSFWKGAGWNDGLRVRVEYRDNSSKSRNPSVTAAALGTQRNIEKSVKAKSVHAWVQTEEVEINDIGWMEKREAEIEEEVTRRLQIKVEREVMERLSRKVQEEREIIERERERERKIFQEEKERYEQQRQKEYEELELDLHLHLGNPQSQCQDALPLISADPPKKDEASMPTPSSTAHPSRNSSTDLATPTKSQFATLPFSITGARPESPNDQRKHAAPTHKITPKKWSPSDDADADSESGSDLSLDLSWSTPKNRFPSADRKENLKSKPKTKAKGMDKDALALDAALEVPDWVLSSAKTTSRDSSLSLSLNSTPLKPKEKNDKPPTVSKTNPTPAGSQEELSLFLGPVDWSDSSPESTPMNGEAFGDKLTPQQESVDVKKQHVSVSGSAPAQVTPTTTSAERKGNTHMNLAGRSGRAAVAREGESVGGVVGVGQGGGKGTTDGVEWNQNSQDWYPLGGWVAQRPDGKEHTNK